MLGRSFKGSKKVIVCVLAVAVQSFGLVTANAAQEVPTKAASNVEAPPVLEDTYLENIENTVCASISQTAVCQAVAVPIDGTWGTVTEPVYDQTGNVQLPLLTLVNVFTPDNVIRSAKGCNARVCIHVTGQGRWADQWETTASQYHSDGCVRPTANFWRRPAHNPNIWNRLAQFSAAQCQSVHPAANSAVWVAEWPYGPLRSKDGAQLCNTWSPFDGAPCILIKA